MSNRIHKEKPWSDLGSAGLRWFALGSAGLTHLVAPSASPKGPLAPPWPAWAPPRLPRGPPRSPRDLPRLTQVAKFSLTLPPGPPILRKKQ